MRLFLPPILIDEEEGFTSEKDIFGRRPIAQGLSNLVTTVEQPLVVAVDAQWGNGKTTFLRMWSGELRKQNIGVIYFDAFENDYNDDAFTTIAAQIITLARDKNKENDGKVKDFANKAIAAGKVITRSALKLGIKVGTAGILEAEDLGNIASDVSGEVSDISDKYLGEIITRHKEQQASIENFRKALAELPSLLSKPTPETSTERRPLVIIIDELDRCRPTFALEMLERIKHFFAVTDVHFILGVHLNQLENSVKATYGADIDSRTYLQKFITTTVHLVDSYSQSSSSSISTFCSYVARELAIPESQNEYAQFVAHIAMHRELSFRTIEKIFSNIAITIAFASGVRRTAWFIIAGLSVLRVTDPEYFVDAKQGRLKFAHAQRCLALDRSSTQLGEYIKTISELWMYMTDGSLSDIELSNIAPRFVSLHLSRNQILPSFAIDAIDNFTRDKPTPSTV